MLKDHISSVHVHLAVMMCVFDDVHCLANETECRHGESSSHYQLNSLPACSCLLGDGGQSAQPVIGVANSSHSCTGAFSVSFDCGYHLLLLLLWNHRPEEKRNRL